MFSGSRRQARRKRASLSKIPASRTPRLLKSSAAKGTDHDNRQLRQNSTRGVVLEISSHRETFTFPRQRNKLRQKIGHWRNRTLCCKYRIQPKAWFPSRAWDYYYPRLCFWGLLVRETSYIKSKRRGRQPSGAVVNYVHFREWFEKMLFELRSRMKNCSAASWKKTKLQQEPTQPRTAWDIWARRMSFQAVPGGVGCEHRNKMDIWRYPERMKGCASRCIHKRAVSELCRWGCASKFHATGHHLRTTEVRLYASSILHYLWKVYIVNCDLTKPRLEERKKKKKQQSLPTFLRTSSQIVRHVWCTRLSKIHLVKVSTRWNEGSLQITSRKKCRHLWIPTRSINHESRPGRRRSSRHASSWISTWGNTAWTSMISTHGDCPNMSVRRSNVILFMFLVLHGC